MLRRTLVLGMLLASTAVAEPHRLKFGIPAGFVSLKDDKGALDLGRREAHARAEAATADAYAVEVAGGVVVATFVAQVKFGRAPLDNWREYLENSLAGTKFARDASVLPAHTLSVGGVQCAVADVERVTDGVAFRERYYVLPAGDRWAYVKLLARPDYFDAAARSVEVIVATTQGLSPISAGPSLDAETQREVLVIAGAAMLCAAILSKWLGRNERGRRHQPFMSPRARKFVCGLLAAAPPLVPLLLFFTDWRIAWGVHKWTAYGLLLFGGAVSLVNFYCSFVRPSVVSALGRTSDAIRHISPIPLFGLAVVPGLLLAPPSGLLCIATLILMLMDTGSFAWFVVVTWTDDAMWNA